MCENYHKIPAHWGQGEIDRLVMAPGKASNLSDLPSDYKVNRLSLSLPGKVV